MKISVVVPVFNEEGNLPALLERLTAVMNATGRPYELVFVDDGSRDRSLEILRAAAAASPSRIQVLQLARNFGQHQAILAAFSRVTGGRRRHARRGPPESSRGDPATARESSTRGTTSSAGSGGRARTPPRAAPPRGWSTASPRRSPESA
jgi:hypothetical protein